MTEPRMTEPRYQRFAGPPSAMLRMSRIAKRPTTRTSAPKSLGRADCMSVPQMTRIGFPADPVSIVAAMHAGRASRKTSLGERS